eukprot:gene35262-43477_t
MTEANGIINEDILRSLFSPFGTIVDVAVIKQAFYGEKSGYGFIHFEDSPAGFQSAQNAVSSLRNVTLENVRYVCSHRKQLRRNNFTPSPPLQEQTFQGQHHAGVQYEQYSQQFQMPHQTVSSVPQQGYLSPPPSMQQMIPNSATTTSFGGSPYGQFQAPFNSYNPSVSPPLPYASNGMPPFGTQPGAFLSRGVNPVSHVSGHSLPVSPHRQGSASPSGSTDGSVIYPNLRYRANSG